MRTWRWISLFILGLFVAGLGCIWIQSPGYMDADYYFATGQELSRGRGFIEPFIWNYLDNPSALSHPSHLYWPPLTSLIAALPMTFFGQTFRAAQIPFILMSALLPVIPAALALQIHGNRSWAWFSGLLALVPGFYLPYMLTTDVFVVYALIGAGFFYFTGRGLRNGRNGAWLVSGMMIGLAHLASADGLLFFLPALAAVSCSGERKLQRFTILISGYLFVMAPWFLRNHLIVGTLLPATGAKTLWLRSYPELFSYPSSNLTLRHFLSQGFGAILQARFAALWINLQRLIGENGLVMLGPLMIIGFRELWQAFETRLAAFYLVILFLTMSFVFPFAGSLGGLFHSSAAMMPLLWALVPAGLHRVIQWLSHLRRWDEAQAQRLFAATIFGMTAILTVGLYVTKVIGIQSNTALWMGPKRTYDAAAETLAELNPDYGIVAINNPPGFYVSSKKGSVVIPYGGEAELHRVVDRFEVEWLVLDVNHPEGLADLYQGQAKVSWLEERATLLDHNNEPVLIFEVH